MKMKRRKVIWSIILALSASTSTTIIISILFRNSSSKVEKRSSYKSVVESSSIRRRLTTSIKIRIPPLELIEYLNRGHAPDDVDAISLLALTDSYNNNNIPQQQQKQDGSQLSASIASIPSSSNNTLVYHPTGTVTLENNLRGHGLVSLMITDLPECSSSSKCNIAVHYGTTCRNIGVALSNWEDVTYTASEGSVANSQIPIKAGPSTTNEYSGHVIVLSDDTHMPIACGVLLPFNIILNTNTNTNTNTTNQLDTTEYDHAP